MSGSAAHIVAFIDKKKRDLEKDGGKPGHLYISPDIADEIIEQCFPLSAYPTLKRPYNMTEFLGMKVHVERGARAGSVVITEKPVE